MTIQRFLRISQLREALGQGPTAIYQGIEDDLLPPPIKRGRSSVWPEGEIAEVQRHIIAGATDDKLRELVKQLVKARSMPNQSAA